MRGGVVTTLLSHRQAARGSNRQEEEDVSKEEWNVNYFKQTVKLNYEFRIRAFVLSVLPPELKCHPS